jgi:anti-anti-sigma factor
MPGIDLGERTIDGVPAVAPSGDLNIHTAPDLRTVLMRHIKRGRPGLMVDLSGLGFMDTSGLATLIEAHLKAEKAEARLVIFAVPEQIGEIFDLTGVRRLLTILEGEQEARAQFPSD